MLAGDPGYGLIGSGALYLDDAVGLAVIARTDIMEALQILELRIIRRDLECQVVDVIQLFFFLDPKGVLDTAVLCSCKS